MTLQNQKDLASLASTFEFDVALFEKLLKQLPDQWRFKALSAEKGASIRILIENSQTRRLNVYELDTTFQQFRLVRNVSKGGDG